jgi:hypothetical protein
MTVKRMRYRLVGHWQRVPREGQTNVGTILDSFLFAHNHAVRFRPTYPSGLARFEPRLSK